MLQGKQVALVPIEKEHLANYVPWFADQDVLEFFGFYTPMNLAQEKVWWEEQNKNPERINFAVEFEGQHIGGCGFAGFDRKNQNAEVGIFIGVKSLWGQGLGQDILTTLVDYGFQQLNLHRIYLRVFAGNERAVRAYEKVGFKHEGRFRESEWRHGRWHDMLYMSILRNEWQRPE